MARKHLTDAQKRRGEALCKKIRETRERLGFSQQRLADEADIPVDTLRAIEQERILVPGIFMAADIVHALDGDLDSWIAGTQTKSKKSSKDAAGGK